MAITAVGGGWGNIGAGLSTLAVSPTAIGDVLVLFAEAQTTTTGITSVSGGGVNSWTKLGAIAAGGGAGDNEIWFGTITATGAATITCSGGWPAGNVSILSASQFTTGGGPSTTWSADSGVNTGFSGSPVSSGNLPSVTPTGAGELYVGLVGIGSGSVLGGSSTGFVYASVGSGAQQSVYNLNASSPTAYAPPFTISAPADYYSAVAGFLIPTAAPLAATLTAPVNSSAADLTGTPTFSWVYNGSGSQTSWGLRRKIGAGAYQYWSVSGTSWQSFQVWNAGTSASYTFPAAAFANGNVYSWSVALQNQSGLFGPYASDFVVTSQAVPVVTVTAPTGSVAATKPGVNWTATFGGSATQTAYQVRTFSSSQYGAGGFNPATSASADDSGVVGSAALTYQVATALAVGAYRSYVQLTETGSEVSAWTAFAAYTVGVDAPPSPALTAVAATDAVTGAPTIALTALAQLNLLTAVDASFEAGIGSFVGTGCALAQSATKALDGSYSLRMTASTTSMSAVTGQYAVAPNQQYTAMASFIAAATGRNVNVAIKWYTAASALISTSTSANVAESTGPSWAQPVVTATAPSNAAFATVTVAVVTSVNTEIHYVDCVGLFIGPAATWFNGGMGQAAASVVILRSDGLYVRGASPANPLLMSNLTQQVTVSDYEAAPGTAYTYTAIVQCGTGAGYLVSAPSAPTSPAVTLVTGDYWIMDPTSVAGATKAVVLAITTTQNELSAAHVPIGQPGVTVSPVIVSSGFTGLDGQATLQVFSAVQYAALMALFTSGKTLWISSPFGECYYGRIGPGQVRNSTLQPSVATNPVRTLAVAWTDQGRPAV